MASKGPAKSDPTENDKLMEEWVTPIITNKYRFTGKTGLWTKNVDRDSVCNKIIAEIESNSGKDAREFARGLTDKANQKLIYRCLARSLKMSEDCDTNSINIAFAAMKMTEEQIIAGLKSTTSASANGGGALYQVGGAFGADVALALLLKLVNTPQLNATLLNAALNAPAAFTYALNWAAGTAGTAGTISDCLKSFLGIGAGAGQSYYAILTNKIAGIYYQGVGSIDAYNVAIKTWLEANPMDALGFTAVVMRYPRIIINITVATIRTLSSITFQTVEVAFAAASTIWASDSLRTRATGESAAERGLSTLARRRGITGSRLPRLRVQSRQSAGWRFAGLEGGVSGNG
jgi:hypothetical protein